MPNLIDLPQELLGQIFRNFAPDSTEKACHLYRYKASYAINRHLLETALQAYYKNTTMRISTDGRDLHLSTRDLDFVTRTGLIADHDSMARNRFIKSHLFCRVRNVYILQWLFVNHGFSAAEELAGTLQATLNCLCKVIQVTIDIHLSLCSRSMAIPTQLKKVLSRFVDRAGRVVAVKMRLFYKKEVVDLVAFGATGG